MDGTTFPDEANAATVLGDADAVQKTTYVVGSGTDPNERSPVSPDARRDEGAPTASAPAGPPRFAVWAAVVALLVAVVLLALLSVRS